MEYMIRIDPYRSNTRFALKWSSFPGNFYQGSIDGLTQEGLVRIRDLINNTLDELDRPVVEDTSDCILMVYNTETGAVRPVVFFASLLDFAVSTNIYFYAKPDPI